MFPQICRQGHEELAFPLRPSLREQKACFDCLSEPDLIRQYRTTRKRISERKKRRLDLVRIEIDLRIREDARRAFLRAGGTALCKLGAKYFAC